MLHFRTSTRCHLVDGSTAKLKSSCSGRGCLVVGVGECGSGGVRGFVAGEVDIQSLPGTAMRRMEARMAIDQGCVE